ncbi:MAG: asparagine synthase (glutamine-hydrolyzing), partial [Deltaproteobacteria bacterium]|nr:asparagine synthase (glutamine-hydrolyzing) [Deltaproteobacteria bacterium]
MCGLGGWLTWSGQEPEAALLQEMMGLVQHRGPDGQSVLFCSLQDSGQPQASPAPDSRWPVALGHRRLAIVDLSQSGVQPMTNEDGRLWLVFNGEIYNFVELRQELLGLGHVFKSRADSEVILHAYESWGLDMLSKFNGMFALALWDSRHKRLVLARDRLGIKPLYFNLTPAGLFFGSELKQFLALPGLQPALNLALVRDFLVHGALDHAQGSLLAGIDQIAPGSWLTVDLAGRVKTEAYHPWPEPAPAQDFSPSERRAAAAKLLALLDEAVGLRLRADVPVGSCLSGGLDSSGVVCLAADRLRAAGDEAVTTGPQQHVFTAAYQEPALDERPFAQMIVQLTSAQPHLVFPTGAGLFEDLERLIWHQDGPVDTPSVYAQYKVMDLVAETGIKVTLDGQGADELLGGYAGHHNAYLAQLIRTGRGADFLQEARGLAAVAGPKEMVRRLAATAAALGGLQP